MKTIKIVNIEYQHVTYIPLVCDMLDNVVYISNEFQISAHRCLCGCGSEVILPLGVNGWLLSETNNKITITPSIGNYNFSL